MIAAVRLIRASAIASSVLCLLACAPSPAPSPMPRAESPRPTPPMPPTVTKLRFAVTRFLSLPQIEEAYGPLTRYLGQKLHVDVELTAPEGYEASGDALGKGEADLADLAPLAYVRAKSRFAGIQPILTLIADGSPTYAGYLVVRSGGPYFSLDDLHGKKLAFVDPESSSGYLYPLYLLRQRGVDPSTFFSETIFLGTHDKVLDAVRNGEVDVGATYSKALTYARNRGVNPMDYRIVAKTPRIPQDAICVRPDLPEAVVENVVQALVTLNTLSPQGRDILGRTLQANGFMPTDDSRYAELRGVAEKLGAVSH
jgi:phosphate/phosphite/phosphonate ABC transporter binding protein